MDERIADPLGSPRPRGSTPKRRGRPPGSVSLTPEIQATILGLVRNGVMPHVAARAAGIAPRTLQEWLARAEGRDRRPPTAKLRAFSKEMRIASALARIDAETRVYRDNPKAWLRNAARTTYELDGWTSPPKGGRAAAGSHRLMEILFEIERDEHAGKQEEPKRPGRPVGSVSLTEEIQRTIVTFVRAGASAHTAAEAAGVSRSTLFEWLARGEDRHRTSPGTPKLRRFAKEVRRAQAEARAGAEARVHGLDPLHWLRFAARSVGEAEGWSDARPQDEEQDDERMAEFFRAFDESEEQASEVPPLRTSPIDPDRKENVHDRDRPEQ